MSKKVLPVVDEADVNRLVEAILKHTNFPSTPEGRADFAYNFALYQSEQQGLSKAWAKELAKKVRQRILWAKPSN